jgi:hypothetical protein
MGVVKVRWTVGSIAVSAPSRTRGDTQDNEKKRRWRAKERQKSKWYLMRFAQ